jgi:hypothetical protein
MNRPALFETPGSDRPIPGKAPQFFSDGPFRKFLGAALRAEMKEVVRPREEEIQLFGNNK